MQTMERRGFLKLSLGIAAAAAVVGSTTRSQAMPVMAPVEPKPDAAPEAAVATPHDVEDAQVEKVQWWRWRRRRYYWRRPWRWRRWRRW
jgi:hypothetical protein